ncbi:adenosylcobinamide-GDP ribazoletransferase [Dyella lipolytica]|nr:adenosylcobinamide-GDP ribazoletransferase [Dyella lipolytica]
MRSLLAAIGFLTRLPVPADVFDDERAKAASLAWYPLVGLLLGALLSALAWLLRDTPSLLSSGLVVVAWVALTGALHLDGLADSADAWIGGLGDREKTLAIMKDPRCGPAGVVALVLALLLKFAALASLPVVPWSALLLAPLLARAGLTALFLTMPYVRGGGLGTVLTNAPRGTCFVALAITAGLCLLGGWRGLLALAAATLVFGVWRMACLRRLGGFTGDTAGALAEMVEVAVLVVLALR